MRLEILDKTAERLQKATFRRTPAASKEQPVSGSIVVMSYRRDLFGKFIAPCFEEGMREATEWSVGEVELFAAFVSQLNKCKY